jgi:hypothetical protein
MLIDASNAFLELQLHQVRATSSAAADISRGLFCSGVTASEAVVQKLA